MKILAVDTSSKNCSTSIVEFDDGFKVLNEKNNDDEKTHSQKLMPLIDEMFKEEKLTLDNIDVLACCLGPGSFTGIRIGIATMKAFADVKNIKTVGVTSLESLCYNEQREGKIFPIIDCKNENVYAALFSHENNSYLQIGDNMAENIDEVLKKYENFENEKIIFIGSGSVLYKEKIQAKFPNAIFSKKNEQTSVSLAKCAYNKYIKGIYGDSNNLSPLYMKKSQAEREKGL